MVQFEDTVFAPLYWGFIAAILLTGCTIVQAYIYFNNNRDGAIVRWTAVSMVVMDVISSGLIAQSIYYYLIPNFGSFHQFESVTTELNIDCLISGIITFISQLYFVRQLNAVRKTGKGQSLAIWATLITAFLGFAGGVGCVGMMIKYNKSVLNGPARSVTFAIFFSLAKGWAAIADIIATIAMCLWLTNSKTGIKETNSLIHNLMAWIMQRGILVTTIQALLLITFWAAPQSLAWFALHMSVTKLYVNTFFAMLNGRSHLRDKNANGVISGINPTNLSQFGVTTAQGRALDHNSLEDNHYDLKRLDNANYPSGRASESDPFSKKLVMPTITKTVIVADV